MVSIAVRGAPVASDWSITDLQEQMGSTASLVSAIHRGVRGIIAVWFASRHEYSWFIHDAMKAKAKDPSSICGWIRIKLSSSPSFVTGYILGTWPRRCGQDASARRCRFKWFFTPHSHSFWDVFHCHLSWWDSVDQQTISLERTTRGRWTPLLTDLSLIISWPALAGGGEHGARTVLVVCAFLILFAVAHFNLLRWLLFACIGWQPYRA